MRRFSERLSSYRPVLDRVVFGLAVLGLLNSAHISIQQQRGFDQGCTGFSAPAFAGSAFDCGTVTSSGASTLLGVSNSVWGVLFYFFVGALTAAAAFNLKERRSDYKLVRSALVAVGFLYSLYLVYYQFFVLEQLCALCLLSAGIVTTLLALHLVDLTRSPSPETEPASSMTWKPSREIAYMGTLVVLLGVLIGADTAYFNNLESASTAALEDFDAAASPLVAQRTAADAQPTSLPAECRYDLEKGRVENFESLVNFYDPTAGNPNAGVTVIEYFDPNCPHCRTLHEIMVPVIRSHADRALFVFKPFWLWQHSIAQSAALYAAAQDGKFFEMLDAQFAMQNPQSGISLEQLRSIAGEIGMDPDVLMQCIESGAIHRTLNQEKQRGIQIGVNSTPTLLINGRFVAIEARTVDCLRRMIEEAGAG